MNGSKFLIVAECDDTSARFLCEQLAADGYALDRARTARHALSLCAMRDPDALIAGDLSRVDSGVVLVRRIRTGETGGERVPADLPALVLGGDHSQVGVLRAFEAGADDVVAAPWSYLELRARLEAILRRCAPPARAQLRVGPLALDPEAGVVRCRGERVGLTRLELATLVRLALDPERVVTKAELLRDVWGYELPGRTRSVDAIACRLRRKLAAAGAGDLVAVVRGVGYRLLPFPDAIRRAA